MLRVEIRLGDQWKVAVSGIETVEEAQAWESGFKFGCQGQFQSRIVRYQ